MIEFRQVSKAYRLDGVRKVILDTEDFRIPRGRNCAVLGPNGAGKSTLLRLISGAERPDRGEIRRHGRVSWPLGLAAGFNGSMTGIENLRFVARIYGADPVQVVAEVNAFAELGPSLALPVRTYSSGMRARLAFGLSLAVAFDCYLIDEVISVGDDRFRRKSRAAFVARRGSAQIVMVSHAEKDVRDYCDCGLLLNQGRVRVFDDVEALLAAHRKLLSG